MTITQAVDTLRKGLRDDGTPYSEAVKTVLDWFDDNGSEDPLIVFSIQACKRIVTVADRVLDGLTGLEARRKYPTEDDYYRAVAEEYVKGLALEEKND